MDFDDVRIMLDTDFSTLAMKNSMPRIRGSVGSSAMDSYFCSDKETGLTSYYYLIWGKAFFPGSQDGWQQAIIDGDEFCSPNEKCPLGMQIVFSEKLEEPEGVFASNPRYSDNPSEPIVAFLTDGSVKVYQLSTGKQKYWGVWEINPEDAIHVLDKKLEDRIAEGLKLEAKMPTLTGLNIAQISTREMQKIFALVEEESNQTPSLPTRLKKSKTVATFDFS